MRGRKRLKHNRSEKGAEGPALDKTNIITTS
jgi:hypothetical protein